MIIHVLHSLDKLAFVIIVSEAQQLLRDSLEANAQRQRGRWCTIMTNDETNARYMALGKYRGKESCVISVQTGSEKPWHCDSTVSNNSIASLFSQKGILNYPKTTHLTRKKKKRLGKKEMVPCTTRIFMCSDGTRSKYVSTSFLSILFQIFCDESM